MVCDRCILVVQQQLDQLGLTHSHIQLGEVELTGTPAAGKLQSLQTNLQALGFEVLDNKKAPPSKK
ncbi:hypothetical protein [Paraflavitalea speifideaquila]|uniref:hypothetical protein n=1 Tax=Paraflavitalea speifideaquila TaxID=3076558 RepID=UPI0028F1255E|nr:hypothetical protein [Paraflavitalea speifideiaquila]